MLSVMHARVQGSLNLQNLPHAILVKEVEQRKTHYFRHQLTAIPVMALEV